MRLTYLVDTDWMVHYLRGEPGIVRILRDLAPQGLATSIISVAELYVGVYLSRHPDRNTERLYDALAIVTVLDLDGETCRLFGDVKSRLTRQGALIGDFDLLIGATCLRYGLTLLTNNRRHFERIEGLEIVSTA